MADKCVCAAAGLCISFDKLLLVDRMAKLVKDLTAENKELMDENQRLNKTVKSVRCCKP